MLFCVPGQYDRLAAQIVSVEKMIGAVVADSSAHRSLVDEGHSLRATLLATPEQRALMATWRMQKEANERRKRGGGQVLRFVPPQGPRSA